MKKKYFKTETWCKKPPTNTIKEYLNPILLGLNLILGDEANKYWGTYVAVQNIYKKNIVLQTIRLYTSIYLSIIKNCILIDNRF